LTGILLGNYETTYYDSKASDVAFKLGIPFLVGYIAILVARVWSLIDAKRCVRREWEIYNRLFSSENVQEIANLQRLVQDVEKSISSIAHLNPPYQCWTLQQQTEFFSTSDDEFIWACPRELQVPGSIQLQGFEAVTSLGYIHKLGLETEMLLRDKVLHWASLSGGYFFALGSEPDLEKGTPSPFFSKASEGKRSSAVGLTTEDAFIHWCALKRLPRAIEKAIRCYNGDVSKLTDFCRQAIIFDSVADITRCLNEIQKDRSVSIVRIKNRLDPKFDAAPTAGYRDVNINIRILERGSDASKKVDEGKTPGQPLATFMISEVQLILRDYAMVLVPRPPLPHAPPHSPFSRVRGHAPGVFDVSCLLNCTDDACRHAKDRQTHTQSSAPRIPSPPGNQLCS
jgi:hypothetical protein